MTIAKKRIYLNMITKNIWLLIGALAVLCAGVIGINAYLLKKTVPVTEIQEDTTEESTVTQPKKSTSTVPEEISSSSEIDTSDWETYRNDKYGFEVKHPSDTNIVKKANNHYLISFSSFTTNRYNPWREYYFTISIKNNPFQLSATQWFEARWAEICDKIIDEKESRCPEGKPFYVLETEEVMINHIPTYVVKTWEGDSTRKSFCMAKKNKLFILEFSLYPDPADHNKRLFENFYNLMIYSFKFIN